MSGFKTGLSLSETGSVLDLIFLDVSNIVKLVRYMCFVVIAVKTTHEVVFYSWLMVSTLNPGACVRVCASYEVL